MNMPDHPQDTPWILYETYTPPNMETKMTTPWNDKEVLDWLDDEWDDRLPAVRGHLINEDCCYTIREAAEHMAKIQSAGAEAMKK